MLGPGFTASLGANAGGPKIYLPSREARKGGFSHIYREAISRSLGHGRKPARSRSDFPRRPAKSIPEREAYLDHACGYDQELRQRAEEFLSAQADIGSFLENGYPNLGVATNELASELVGTLIGPYKLL